MKKLLLVDGSNLIFRAYYATEKNDQTNLDNVPINAVRTLINMINKIISDEKPDYFFIGLDTGHATFRHKMYEEYKGKRDAAPEKLKVQFPIVKELFESMGIKFFYTDEYEADDLIASYARKYENELKVKIITGDKDLLQLVDDNIEVLTPKMGFAKEVNYTYDVFFEKYTFEPKKMIDYKALVGDSSDNIIGINKLGDKTAKKLLIEYNSMNEIIDAAKSGIIRGVVGENIAANEDVINRNLKLVKLVDDLELPYELDEIVFSDFNYKTYAPFLKNQGFVRDFQEIVRSNKYIKDENELDFENIEFTHIDKFDIKYVDGAVSIYTQNLKHNYFTSENLGFGIVSNAGSFYFEKANQKFIEFLKLDNFKIIYNYKQFLSVLNCPKVCGEVFDPYLALILIDSKNFSLDITNIVNSYGIHYTALFSDVYGTKINPKIKNHELMEKDLVSKALAFFEIHSKIKSNLEDMKLNHVYNDIELPLSRVLAKVELEGIYIDKEQLNITKDMFESENEILLNKLNSYADINFNSSTQLSNLLFDTWNLPKQGLKKTQSAYSTDISNLSKLITLLDEDNEDKKEFLNILLDYRKNSKILSTYLKNLEKFILSDNKIHPINNQLSAETGRLSVMDPSIQNMPISGKYSQYIRSLFAADTGHKIVAFDYSQIELRIMASFSQDPNMLESFKNDLDIHEDTARKIFNLDEVTSEMRSHAKAINFGIIYGMSSYGLAKQVGITNDMAREFIDKYFENFPKIQEFIDKTIDETTIAGYSTTISGRRRKIDSLDSKNFRELEQAKRIAINTPIQGSAADLLKLALIKVEKEINEKKLDSKMIMQIHDEIVFIVPNKEVDKMIEVVKDAMENVIDIGVKLKVDYKVGENWLQTK